jgi:hypothetical protein
MGPLVLQWVQNGLDFALAPPILKPILQQPTGLQGTAAKWNFPTMVVAGDHIPASDANTAEGNAHWMNTRSKSQSKSQNCASSANTSATNNYATNTDIPSTRGRGARSGNPPVKRKRVVSSVKQTSKKKAVEPPPPPTCTTTQLKPRLKKGKAVGSNTTGELEFSDLRGRCKCR